jgi:predicted enzyme related to lactoylglutathione lyase
VSETSPRGRFVWHELMTTDAEAAIKFYPSVTAWGVLPFDLDPSYRMWTVNGAPIGGVLPLTDDAKAMGAPAQWLPYIGTQDIVATLAHATRLGATTLIQPTAIAVGRYAVLRDPQGATFALFQATERAPGHEGRAAIGEFSWHELRTTDWSAALSFYKQLFGWNETTSMDMGAEGKYQMFGRNGVELGGMYNKGPRVQGPPAWLSYVRTRSTDQAVAAAKRLGGTVVNGPMSVPGGNYIAEMRDAQGVAFALHEQREAVETAPMVRPAVTARPAAQATAQAKTAPTAQVAAAPTSSPKPKSKAKPKAKPKSKRKPKTKARAKPKAKSKAKRKAKARPKAKAKPKSKARSKAKAKAKKKKGAKKRSARRHR